MPQKFNVLSVDCDWVFSLKHQAELLSFLIPILNKNNNIKFSHDHHDINKYFNCDFEECNLINIDHHHDAGYKEDHKFLNPGNWLYHLHQIFPKKINYTWICNTNSKHLEWGHYLFSFNNNIKNYSFDFNLDKVQKNNYDLIFICCSPEYNLELGLELGITNYKILENVYGT